MWNENKSLVLSKACVCLFAALLLALDIGGYPFARLFVSLRGMPEDRVALFAATIYTVSVPAWITLFSLWLLLRAIGGDDVFSAGNVRRLRGISWCCLSVGVVCALSAAYYLPFLIAAAAAVFMALIVRIVKNCFEQAARMRDELDYTV